MKMEKTVIMSMLFLFGVHSYAGQIDGDAVLGSVVGAAAGSAIGSATGGRDGAIIGGGIGGAVGAAVGSNKSSPRPVGGAGVVVVDNYHDGGRHKGQYKHRHQHRY